MRGRNLLKNNCIEVNPLSTDFTNWPDKRIVHKMIKHTNCLSVFDHFDTFYFLKITLLADIFYVL